MLKKIYFQQKRKKIRKLFKCFKYLKEIKMTILVGKGKIY